MSKSSANPTTKAQFARALATTLLIIGAAVSMEANAGDAKRYPGTMCVSTGGASAPTYTLGTAQNTTSSTRTLNCSVVRDKASSSNDINSGEMRVVDQSSSGNVTCTLFALTRGSSSFSGWWDTATTSGFSSNDKVLSYGSLPYNYGSHVFFKCTLPAESSGRASYVVSYLVNEGA